MREPAFWYGPPSLTARALRPLGAIYGAITSRRMTRQGWQAPVPVLCVGNFHLGGAGKTPTVLALSALLREWGETPVVLSRGYGGRLTGPVLVDAASHEAADVGDEPLMMARRIAVVVARHRPAGVALACSCGATVVVMDDGFQNPALTRDLSLIVVDGGRGIGNEAVFPAGPLRAPLQTQLARADALIIIGAGAGGERLRALAGDIACLSAALVPDAAAVATLRQRPVFAFAGIGDPERFFRSLRACDIHVAGTRAFPDHHVFTRAEIDDLRAQALQAAATLVTTEKDMARLSGMDGFAIWGEAIMALPVRLEFEDEAGWRGLIGHALDQARSRRQQP
ncbi:MAG: tetraacyldisaccharide 4'-kinase [Alphaproteobacteria bacterium]|nr:tetraacyldisaccharide 4'-kinase [Alphaproteobacteria bacterium]